MDRRKTFKKVICFRRKIHTDILKSIDNLPRVRGEDNPRTQWEEIHSSGHASIDDLKLLANSIKPKQLVPIHTFYPDQYKKHFQNVIELSDGDEKTL